MTPKVSIIIPNYNHVAFLQQRLDSVFNQTFQDFEVILLDDASTDDSVNILETYKNHPKVSSFIVNTENSGSPFKQWQKGIELAAGDYIWIAESDDYCELNFLECCIAALNANENIGLVFTAIIEKANTEVRLFQLFKEGLYKRPDFLYQNMLRTNSIKNASSVLFSRKDISDESVLELNNFKICGDWWLWVNIIKSYDLFFLEQPLSTYRKHEEATTYNLMENPKFYDEILHILMKIFKDRVITKEQLDSTLQFWIAIMKSRNIPKLEKKRLIKEFKKLCSLEGQVKLQFKRLLLAKNSFFKRAFKKLNTIFKQ